jgi:hypothetical protein
MPSIAELLKDNPTLQGTSIKRIAEEIRSKEVTGFRRNVFIGVQNAKLVMDMLVSAIAALKDNDGPELKLYDKRDVVHNVLRNVTMACTNNDLSSAFNILVSYGFFGKFWSLLPTDQPERGNKIAEFIGWRLRMEYNDMDRLLCRHTSWKNVSEEDVAKFVDEAIKTIRQNGR